MNLFFFAGVMVPFFMDWGRISFYQIFILQAVFGFSTFIWEIPTGAIADYMGRKKSLLLGSFLMAVACLVYIPYQNFYIFCLGEFIWGLSYALISGADEAMLYDTLIALDKDRSSKKILGRFHSFEPAAIMLAAPAGSILASHFGLRFTVFIMVIPFSLGFLTMLSVKEPPYKHTDNYQNYFTTVFDGIVYFSRHKLLQLLAFDRISISVLVFMLVWVYQPILKNLSVPVFIFGFVTTAITAIQVIFLNNFEFLEKIFRSKTNYLTASALISGTGFIMLAMSKNAYLSIFLFILIAGFGMTRFVLFQNYMNKYIESDKRATVISTVSMLRHLIKTIVYIIVALMVKWSFTITLVILGVTIILFALISKVEESHLIN